MTAPVRPTDPPAPCIIGKFCARHDFVHGSEAEELREKMERFADTDQSGEANWARRILDEVDARDSCAWVEVNRAINDGELDPWHDPARDLAAARAEAASLRERLDGLQTELESHANQEASRRVRTGQMRGVLARRGRRDANDRNERTAMIYRIISEDELTKILADHGTWRSSGGKSGARADLTDANLTDANLADADLTHANLTHANLTRADLTGANLTRANLTRANLTNANLTHANLTHANLTRANLTRANLTGADLARANLTGADLARANLTDADLTDANLTDANLTD